MWFFPVRILSNRNKSSPTSNHTHSRNTHLNFLRFGLPILHWLFNRAYKFNFGKKCAAVCVFTHLLQIVMMPPAYISHHEQWACDCRKDNPLDYNHDWQDSEYTLHIRQIIRCVVWVWHRRQLHDLQRQQWIHRGGKTARGDEEWRGPTPERLQKALNRF